MLNEGYVVMKKILLFLGLVLCCAGGWAQEAKLAVETLVKSELSWNGVALPEYPQGQPEVTILRIVIPPKTKLPVHEHPVINAGVLLRGELTVITKENQVLNMKAGDPIVEVVDTWHYGINEGEEDAEIIVFYAGTKDSPITIKEN